jgi:hypothetical protein
MPASAKYRLRSPRIANTLLVNTRNGSVVIAKIAGIESTAKIRSVNSTRSSARNSGVARSAPLWRRRHDAVVSTGRAGVAGPCSRGAGADEEPLAVVALGDGHQPPHRRTTALSLRSPRT